MKKSLFEYLGYGVATNSYREKLFDVSWAEVSPNVAQKLAIHLVCDEGFIESKKSAEMKQVRLVSLDESQIFTVNFFRFTPAIVCIRGGAQTLLKVTLKTKIEEV